jgi:iron complex transport system ATP-binding protein
LKITLDDANKHASALDVRALGLRAGERELLRGLTLRIERGQFWAVVGPNGSGKTTLLATLAGIATPAAGEIDLLGHPIGRWTAADAAIVRGFLPQHVEPLFGVSVLQAALLGRHPHQGRRLTQMWESAADVSIAIDALEQVDLHGLASRDVATLSGGERQRVAIASLLAQDPLLYLLDEPLSHLDLHHQHAAMQLLRRRADEGQRALVASVHELSMAARFATHALVFSGGTACVNGTAAAVLDEATLSAAFGHSVRRLVDGETVALVAG